MSTQVLQAMAGAAEFPFSRSRGPLVEAVSGYGPLSEPGRWHSDWAWEHYAPLALHLARQMGVKRLLEVGGGRDPGFATTAPAAGLSLIVNDIDPRELALLPPGLESACFDIAGDLSARPELAGSCDMLASRMVFEHVHDVAAAWRNAHRLLRPGGVAMAFFPTLYSWPFVLNKLLPGELAKKIVQTFTTQDRSDNGENPVFPPVYSWCYGSESKLRSLLEPMGWSEIVVLPFWGHRYLDRIPVAREIDGAFNRLCATLDWRAMTTYATVILRK